MLKRHPKRKEYRGLLPQADKWDSWDLTMVENTLIIKHITTTIEIPTIVISAFKYLFF